MHGLTRNAVYLRPVGNASGGAEIRRGAVVTLGQSASNHIQIRHGSIADFHCRFTLRGDELYVQPLQGTVRIGGVQPSGWTPVPPGSRIGLGNLQFEVHATPVVVATEVPTFADELRKELTRLVRRVPWVLLSVLAHALLLWSLNSLTWRKKEEARELAIRTQPVLPEPESLLEHAEMEVLEAVPPELRSASPEAAETLLESLETAAAQPAWEEDTSSPWMVGTGRGGGGTGLAAGGRLRLPGDTGSGDLVAELRAMRASGLDVLLLVDTTSSMRPFLEQAKGFLDDLVTRLAELVPDLRIGVIAYRDEGDAYVTRVLDLSEDRYEILNFVLELDAEGGMDIPEAVDRALETGVYGLRWRPATRKVMVLVGDAPPHEEDWETVRRALQHFGTLAAAGQAQVSTLFTGFSGELAAGKLQRSEQAFAEIARLGNGEFHRMGMEDAQRGLLLSVLGHRHADDLDRLLSGEVRDPREQLLERKIRERDVPWLLEKLNRTPVHPGVVQALRDLAGKKELRQVAQLLLDERRSLPTRRACLYLLRKALNTEILLDPALPLARQSRYVAQLQGLVK